MKTYPINERWLHTYFLAPFLQGCEMVTRAWKGVDFHSLVHRSFSWKERIVFLLVGASLLIPFINTIIWVFWKTFGSPEILFNPFCPEETQRPPPRIVRRLIAEQPSTAPIQLIPFGNGQIPNRFIFDESGTTVNWTLQRTNDVIFVQQKSALLENVSEYYPNGVLQEYYCKKGKDVYEASLTDATHLKVELNGKETTLELKEAIPWVQQPTVGFTNFILSDETKIHTYAIVFANFLKNPFFSPWLSKFSVEKAGEEEVPGFGKLLKIVVKPTEMFLNRLMVGYLWFDPKTAILKKFSNEAPRIREEGVLVQSSPSR